MKRQNHYFFLLLLCLAIGIGLVVWAIFDSGRKPEKYRISVVVDNSESNRWVPFLEGLKRASKDNDVALNYVSTGKMTGLEQEKGIIDQEIENGTDALIVQFCQSSQTKELVTDISGQTILELVGTDVDRDTISTENCACVSTDDVAIGKALAAQIVSDQGSLANEKIGIFMTGSAMKAVRDRRDGFEEDVRKAGATILWEIKDDRLTEQQIEEKQREEAVDILVAMDDESLQVLNDYLTATGASYPLYGVGCSDRNVYCLDNGQISAMAVPYEFNMGYQAVTRAVGKLKNPMSGMQNDTVDFAMITKENMTDEKNQRLLYPIVQ